VTNPITAIADVERVENVWIPTRDSTRIAATLWRPRNPGGRLPAILSCHPYRTRDISRVGDDAYMRALAARGYVCVQADVRGSGESDGLLTREYSTAEQEDSVDLIAWIAEQDWCTGAVGMTGGSWSGYGTMLAAARRPPALKAIIVHCSSDDHYEGDAHYWGGCANEGMLTWGSAWLGTRLAPPDPAIVGEGWREAWLERLEAADPSLETWLRHSLRDDLWRHASLREDYGAIQVPVYAVGGWADPYRAAVLRLMENLSVPRKGLLGPWGHSNPHDAPVGPRIDWIDEAVRWWDHWLKGRDTGLMAEPMLRVWLQERSARPGDGDVPGRWIGERTWPSPRVSQRVFHLGPDSLGPEVVPGHGGLTVPADHSVGGGKPGRHALASDQRDDDARSLSLDSEPLTHDLVLLGAPVADLVISADRPVAHAVVRLAEVLPDGESRLLTVGVLDLTHDAAHETREPIGDGEMLRRRIPLEPCAQLVRAGNRLRLAVSSSNWPTILSAPETVTLTVHAGSSIALPVRADVDDALRPFAEPEPSATTGVTIIRPGDSEAADERSPDGTLTRRGSYDAGLRRLDDTGTVVGGGGESSRSLSLRGREIVETAEISGFSSLERPDWAVEWRWSLRMRMSRDLIRVDASASLSEAGTEIATRSWSGEIPRFGS
jgi:putative CocE/NonD family hydrolase